MSKKGYKCIKWTPEHDQFLMNNYATLNNEEIAALLNNEYKLKRTPDAVRKQLNKLLLRRPKKSEIKKLDKAIKNDNFFKQLSKGLQKRKQVEKSSEQDKRNEIKRKKEIDWAEKVYGIKPKNAPPEKVKESNEKDLVWITINKKTRMQVPRGTEQKWIDKFKEKEYGL